MSFPVEVPSLKFYRGDDFAQSYRFNDALGDLADLSTFTGWRSQWRPYADAVEVIDLTVTVTVVDARVTVSVSAADTIAMNRSGVFDVQATDGDGLTKTFVYGSTEFAKDVTDD